MEESRKDDELTPQSELFIDVDPSPNKPIGYLMLITLAAFIASALIVSFTFAKTSLLIQQIAGAVITTFGAILVPSLVHIFTKRQEKDRYNLNRLHENQILPCIMFGIGLSFAALVFANLIQATYFSFGVDLSKIDTPLPDLHSPLNYIVIVLCVAVAPAVCEEMLCRSALLYSFRSQGMYRAALWSGLFFALLHLNLTSLPVYVALGLIFGIIAYKTRSVFSTMIVHFTYNFTLISLQLLPFAEDETSEVFSLASPELWIAVAVFAVIAAAFLVPASLVFRKNCNKNDEKEAQKLGVTKQEYLDLYNHGTENHAPYGNAAMIITYILLVVFTIGVGITEISECIVK